MTSAEIRIAGFGGQGVVLAGMVIGNAATLHDNKFVTLTQSFGPEARGTTCSVQLIVAPEPILYPYLSKPDLLVVMSQDANEKYGSDLKPTGLLLYEEDLIESARLNHETRAYGIPATRIAEELGRKMVLNMVMVGFVTAITEVISPEAARAAIKSLVPRGTDSLNLSAFEKGFEYGKSLRARELTAA